MPTQEWLNRCFNCMAPLHDPQERCSVCGWDNRRRVNGEGRLEQMMLKGQYLVGRALGRGGFGVTYMGFDLNLNRRVAIKEYFPLSMAYRHTDQTTVRPYENAVDDYTDGLRHAHDEGQTAAKLGHIPNIVQVYNAFPENGTVYIVMEYIEGTTLAQMVKEHGRMPWQRALELLYPIMRALEKAHAKRIIHRDISPDNIMLSRETGETVLLDFGAAREAKAGLTAVLRPGYAPLEQYSEQTTQDGRVDEYALCATMYYLVTGTVPESSDLRAYVKRPLKSPRALGCDIPPKVEAVLMKGMSLQAADRYESMVALRHAFEQAADRERKQSVSRKGLIALLVALALVVTGVLGWILLKPPIGVVEAPVIHVGGQAPEQGKVLTLTVEADEASVPIEWSAEGDVQGYSVRVSDGTSGAVTEMDFRGGKSCNIDSGNLETGIVYTVEVGVIPTGGSVKNAVWGRERFILVKAETAQEEAPAPEPETPTPAPETPTPAPETPTPAPETPTPAPETPSPEPETPTLTLKEKPTSKPTSEPTPEPVAEVSVPEITVDPVVSEADGIAYVKAEITIRWTCEGDVEEYQVSVTDSDGTLLASTSTSNEQISARSPRAGEVYTITVTAIPRNGTLEADGVSGTVRVALYVEPTPEPTPKPTPEPTPEVSLEEAMAEARAHSEAWTISAGYEYTVGLKRDGTVVTSVYKDDYYVGQCDLTGWTDIVAVSAGYYHTVGLKRDGTVVATRYTGNTYEGQCNVGEWTDIVAVSAGYDHTVGLKRDGTVVAVGDNASGQCDVGEWTDIVAVSAGYEHTVGLKRDGTVVATRYTGKQEYYKGQCNVGDWTDIVAVSAGLRQTVGLKRDGTVVAAGKNEYGECDVGEWTDIVAVSAGSAHTVGLKRDGTVVATQYTGDNYFGECDVSDWTDIVAVSADGYHTLGLKSDGTMVATKYTRDNIEEHGEGDVGEWHDIALPDEEMSFREDSSATEPSPALAEAMARARRFGANESIVTGWRNTVALKTNGTVMATGDNEYGQCDVGDWTDIVAVSAGSYHTVGLKQDGTVVAVGRNNYGQCNVSWWTDIVAVSTSYWHTVGLKRDGTVVAVGDNDYGQCDVNDWTDIVAVSAGGSCTVGLKRDGTVVATLLMGEHNFSDGQYDASDWTDIVAIFKGKFGLKSDGTLVAGWSRDDKWNGLSGVVAVSSEDLDVFLKSDGTVMAEDISDTDLIDFGQANVGGWTDIVAVSTSGGHTVGLKRDGTVVAVGNNKYGQCDVGDWTDVVAVFAGYPWTVGLKRDGTVVAVGDNKYGQCDVGDWTDVVVPDEGVTEDVSEMSKSTPESTPSLEEAMAEARAHSESCTISSGNYHTVILKQDGTVISVGDYSGEQDTSDWTDIVAVAEGGSHTVGLKRDGTVVAVGKNENGQCDVSDWTDIVAVAAGYHHTVGLRRDGTVVATEYKGNYYYNQCDVGDWSDIVAVSAGETHTVGLKRDGTVVAVGRNLKGECDVGDWSDIVAVAAGTHHTVGLRANGTVVATKYTDSLSYYHGECEVYDWRDIVAVAADTHHTVGLKRDGTVVVTKYQGDDYRGQCEVSDWTDIVSIAATFETTIGLKRDGTVIAIGEGGFIGRWTDIYIPDTAITKDSTTTDNTTALKVEQLALLEEAASVAHAHSEAWTIGAGNCFTVALRQDGTVAAAGSNIYAQCVVETWKDIVAVATGEFNTIGLKRDGTVVAAGLNSYGQCNVSGWTDIVAVSTGGYHTVGLKRDGTVVTVGNESYGQCDVGDWTDIVAVSVGRVQTVGLRSDGTVVATGYNGFGQCDVSKWSDIVAISAGDFHTLGLKRDGTVVSTTLIDDDPNDDRSIPDYGQCNVSGWTDIVAIASCGYHTVGLKRDGTVVATGDNEYGQCDVSDWTDIVAVSAGTRHTVGLKRDGAVVATRYTGEQKYYYGECDVGDWTDIMVPDEGVTEDVGEMPKPAATEIPDLPVLSKGDKSEAVAAMQRQLISMGFLSGSADGDFGKMTESAVMQAQAEFGMAQDGIASAEFQWKLSETYGDYIAQYSVGNVVIFGHYDQDGNEGNGEEPIEWIVLSNDGETVMLISKYGLDSKPYNQKRDYVSWKTCSLRKWLNGEFLNTAFSAEEQARLETIEVNIGKYASGKAEYTKDRVFLLSVDESERYFSSEEDRKCLLTRTALDRGAWGNYYLDGTYSCVWWLRREITGTSIIAPSVTEEGRNGVEAIGNYVDSSGFTVRPVVALHI